MTSFIEGLIVALGSALIGTQFFNGILLNLPLHDL
jgi:hypothetical protein